MMLLLLVTNDCISWLFPCQQNNISIISQFRHRRVQANGFAIIGRQIRGVFVVSILRWANSYLCVEVHDLNRELKQMDELAMPNDSV